MYTSGPIHLHIICDEAAQTYIEKRLSIVPRPRFDVFVRFYRLAWQAMVDRIEREGKIGSKHAAGTRKCPSDSTIDSAGKTYCGY